MRVYQRKNQWIKPVPDSTTARLSTVQTRRAPRASGPSGAPVEIHASVVWGTVRRDGPEPAPAAVPRAS